MTRDIVSVTLLPVGEPNFNKTQRSTKQINFYFNLLNLLNHFDKGIGFFLRKAAHLLGGMDSSKSPPLEGRAAPPP
jgi:hypothetical protein